MPLELVFSLKETTSGREDADNYRNVVASLTTNGGSSSVVPAFNRVTWQRATASIAQVRRVGPVPKDPKVTLRLQRGQMARGLGDGPRHVADRETG
jgi:hypothetical protein